MDQERNLLLHQIVYHVHLVNIARQVDLLLMQIVMLVTIVELMLLLIHLQEAQLISVYAQLGITVLQVQVIQFSATLVLIIQILADLQ